MVTLEEIENAKTVNGGWTKAQLKAWGVPWPPPKGWKYALVNCLPIPKRHGKKMTWKDRNPKAFEAWRNGKELDAELKDRINRDVA